MSDPRIRLQGATPPRGDEVLTPDALAFVAALHARFDARRRELLAARRERQARFDVGDVPRFLDHTAGIRRADWTVGAVPQDLQDRRVEITGPVDAKMIINALNSGARVFMADFEDSCSPTWSNVVEGQLHLRDAVRRTLTFTAPDGRTYELDDEVATLVVRPRGWHLDERHAIVDRAPVSASLWDFGLFLFQNAHDLLERGSGPYFYLPKLESHLEARLWNDVFVFAERELSLQPGTIKATVLIETITAAFEMDEILYELREHVVGLNAGRWDYIFSVIKKFREDEQRVLPDRRQITMSVPFMRAYTQLLVQTCHRRGAHAMGGMSAFIPSRRDEEINRVALEQVRADKQREVADGCDGTWVAHPDLVAVAREVFDAVLGDRPNQVDRQRDDVNVSAFQLADIRVPGGAITEAGLRANVRVGVAYLASWLWGNGAAAIDNLMEDAATAEIARAQVWQWIRHGAKTDAGVTIDAPLVGRILDEELATWRDEVGDEAYKERRFEQARKLFEQVALSDDFPEFLTLPAYEVLEPN